MSLFTGSDTPPRVKAPSVQEDSFAARVWFILKINTGVLSQISSVHSVKRRWTSMIDLIVLLKEKRPIHHPSFLTDQKQVFGLVINAQLKGIVYPNDKNSVIIYSPTGYSKPVFFHGSQKEIFCQKIMTIYCLGKLLLYSFLSYIFDNFAFIQ